MLNPSDIANFPSLAAGEWHPATLVDTSGNVEVVKVTTRSSNTLTATRAQEGTAARSFATNSRCEIRLTSGAINELQSEANDYTDTEVASEASARDAAITTAINALRTELTAALTMPTGTLMAWSRPSLPTGWIWADGSVMTSGTTYTALRNALIADGFPYGQDGSGNPKLPDLRGRTPAGKDNMGGSAASRLTSAGSGVDGATLGASGGAETHTLTSAQMPVHTHTATANSHTVSDPGHAHNVTTTNPGSDSFMCRDTSNGTYNITGGGPTNGWTSGAGDAASANTGISLGSATPSITVQNAGSGGAHNNVQPTLVTGWVIKT